MRNGCCYCNNLNTIIHIPTYLQMHLNWEEQQFYTSMYYSTTSPPTSTLKDTYGEKIFAIDSYVIQWITRVFGPLWNLNLKNLTPKLNVLRFPVKLSTADHPLKIEDINWQKNQHIHCIIHAAMEIKGTKMTSKL